MGREGQMDCGRGIPIEGVWLVANAASNKHINRNAGSQFVIIPEYRCPRPVTPGVRLQRLIFANGESGYAT